MSIDVVVTGAGGFIGGHMAKHLIELGGYNVRCTDHKPLHKWWQLHDEAQSLCLNLSDPYQCAAAVAGTNEVYNFAANMGGMGFVARNRALCARNVLINTNLLHAANEAKVSRYFYASTACVYSLGRQNHEDIVYLREEDVQPLNPEPGYGEEKWFSEQLCRYYRNDFGLETRIARFHNVYGPYGHWIDPAKAKAPAALCAQVASAKMLGGDSVKIWGSGSQIRSFAYVDDVVYGAHKLMRSDHHEPLNIGSTEPVTINKLIDVIEVSAGTSLKRIRLADAPTGVGSRSSDNTLIKKVLDWEPRTTVAEGIPKLYRWVEAQLQANPALASS